MKTFLQKVAKLVDVKSIITITLTFVFAYLSATQIIKAEQFMTVFAVIISFYFGTQYEKNNNNNGKE